MTKMKLGYPFSYGDDLSPQQARANFLKISTFKKEVFLALCFFMSSARVASARDFLLLGADGFTPAITRKRPSITIHQSSDAFQPIAPQQQYPPARNLLPGLGKKPNEQSSAYQEVERRAQAIGNPDFSCSFDRFKELATEKDQITPLTTREAISGLQFEAQGLVINLRRSAVQDSNNLGVDFEIDGPPPYTHFEQKGPVGSAIRDAAHLPSSITKQGKKVGQKAVHQKKVWSGGGEGKALTPGNILIGVDCFDGPGVEKAAMEAAVLKGAKNTPDIVFINNVTNI
jgi:hypothetical protein